VDPSDIKTAMEASPISVLLVDDEGVYISLLAEQLRSDYGYDTSVAYSGSEIIGILQTGKRFDVIILDYKMPDIDGLGVLRWLHEQKDETPVIVLTAAGSEEVVAEAMKLGAYEYLRKEHLDLHELARAIRATHERNRMAKEKQQAESAPQSDAVSQATNTLLVSVENAIGRIIEDLNTRTEELAKQLPPEARGELERMGTAIKGQIAQLNVVVGDLLRIGAVIRSRKPTSPPPQSVTIPRDSSSGTGEQAEKPVIASPEDRLP
jgi:DNA-binding response OmpR family regulator